MKREYPCKVFTLTANYNVRPVNLARPYSESSDAWGAYTANRKFYASRDIFDTKTAAVKAGRSRIARRKKSLERAMDQLHKDSAALDKATAPTSQGESK